MKHAHIDRSRHLWPVRLQCEVLDVSFTGHRQHPLRRKKLCSRRHMSEEALLVNIRAIHAEPTAGPGCGASCVVGACAWARSGCAC